MLWRGVGKCTPRYHNIVSDYLCMPKQKKTVHTFAKSISLDDDIDTQSLSAEVVDGVLVITAEKLKKEEKEEEWMKIDVVESKN